MHTLYPWVSGPLVWAAAGIFLVGGVIRVGAMARLAARKDTVVYAYWDGRFALRSIFRWVFPFTTAAMRHHPLMMVVTFLFHAGVLLVPLFLSAHVILVKESWNLGWWHLPDPVADVLTVGVISACVFFGVRRRIQPEVRYLTSPADFGILVLVAAPFVTGFWAYHQWPWAEWMTLAHMFSGEALLASIPFTRLSHMLFFPLTRAYMGSEFGAVRHVRDW